jgi:hypothetical protein
LKLLRSFLLATDLAYRQAGCTDFHRVYYLLRKCLLPQRHRNTEIIQKKYMFFSVLLWQTKSAAGRINKRIHENLCNPWQLFNCGKNKKAPQKNCRALAYNVQMKLLFYQFLYNDGIICCNVQHVWCTRQFIQVVNGKPVKAL